jgi:hypothetical protein
MTLLQKTVNMFLSKVLRMRVVWSEPFFMTSERTPVIENKAFNLPCLTETDVGQGCQIFLGKTYQNGGGECTKLPQTIPNERKKFQMAYQHFPFQGPPYTKIGISGMITYVPSGNPDIGFLFLWLIF